MASDNSTAKDIFLASKSVIEKRKSLFRLAAAFEKSGEREAAVRCYQLFARPADQAEESIYRKFKGGGRAISLVTDARSAVNYIFTLCATNKIFGHIKDFFEQRKQTSNGFVIVSKRRTKEELATFQSRASTAKKSAASKSVFQLFRELCKMEFDPQHITAISEIEYRLREAGACGEYTHTGFYTTVGDILDMDSQTFAEELLNGRFDLCSGCKSVQEISERRNFIISSDALGRLSL